MKTLIIKSVRPNFTTRNNFQWPTEGFVTCPDWNPIMNCGNGLHGLRLNQNDPGVWNDDGKFLLLEVEEDKIIDLFGKCKFPEANVLKVFDSMEELTNYLYEQNINIDGMYQRTQSTDKSVNWIGGFQSNLKAGNNSVLKAEDFATLKAGEYSFLTAENESILKAGDYSKLEAGEYSELEAGDKSTLQSTENSILIAGDNSTLEAGDYCTLKSGHYSTLVAKYNSSLEAKEYSNLIAENRSTFCAGYGSVFVCRIFNGLDYKTYTAIVGENGILPNTSYKLNENGEFVPL